MEENVKLADGIRVSEAGEIYNFKTEELHIESNINIKTKQGRRELTSVLFQLYGELRTQELRDLLRRAGVHHRSRPTISGDLKSLMERGEIKKVHKGLYRSEHPSFHPYEKDELREFVESCNYSVNQEKPKHPIGTTYLLSNGLPPKGFYYKFSDIGEKVLDRCVQNLLMSSYLRVSGQRHIPIAPCQLDGRVEIPKEQLDEIWRERGFRGKLLVAFLIDFQELHRWLKTEEGRHWLGNALKETPTEFEVIAKGIGKALGLIDKKGMVSSEEVACELEKLGIPDNVAKNIQGLWMLPYIESSEIEGHVHYLINPKDHDMVLGWQRLEEGRDPAYVYKLMRD